MNPDRLSPDARKDFEAIIDDHLDHAGFVLAERSCDAAIKSLNFVRDFPNAGSLRLGINIRNTRARCRPVGGFPYLVIRRVEGDRPEILRILHAARDIPASLRQPE